jgi:ABC-type lipoprotein release transport system permease subunit
MSIAHLTPASVQSNLLQVNPHTQVNNNSTPVQADQSAQKAVQAIRTDTVAISSQALQLARGGHSVEKEAKESAA